MLPNRYAPVRFSCVGLFTHRPAGLWVCRSGGSGILKAVTAKHVQRRA